jgi:protein-disulfide isomerase
MPEDTHSHSTPPTRAATLALKDILIPASIVVAGVFIGLGLYFGGSGSAETALVAKNDVPAEETGSLEKLNPVAATEHIKGNPDAPVKIVEFSDFDCPFCSRFHQTMNDIVAERKDDVAWVYRHFPLEQLHPNAPAVALASECVAELGGNDAFWKFTDAYFEKRGSGDREAHATLVPTLAVEAGVARAAFDECFSSGRLQKAVDEDLADAIETGGRGTPWGIVIGPSGKTYPINGAVPAAAIIQVIELAQREG